MSKIEPLKSENYSPKVCLAEMLETADDLDAVVVLMMDKMGNVKVCYSHQRSYQLYSMFVKFQGEINEHALGRTQED